MTATPVPTGSSGARAREAGHWASGGMSCGCGSPAEARRRRPYSGSSGDRDAGRAHPTATPSVFTNTRVRDMNKSQLAEVPRSGRSAAAGARRFERRGACLVGHPDLHQDRQRVRKPGRRQRRRPGDERRQPRSAGAGSCFLAKEQSRRTAWRARSLLSRTTSNSAAELWAGSCFEADPRVRLSRLLAVASPAKRHSSDGFVECRADGCGSRRRQLPRVRGATAKGGTRVS